MVNELLDGFEEADVGTSCDDGICGDVSTCLRRLEPFSVRVYVEQWVGGGGYIHTKPVAWFKQE